jgi:hypothetical protein
MFISASCLPLVFTLTCMPASQAQTGVKEWRIFTLDGHARGEFGHKKK